jgi:hypothetical protein
VNHLSEREVEQHATILGWLHIASNALILLCGCFVFVLLVGIGTITEDPVAFSVLGVTGATVGALLVVLALPGIVAGVGLLQRKGWGRILAMVVGFLGLVNFPIGTAIGLYTFWALLQTAAADVFEP